MAEERNLATVRATEVTTDTEDVSKEELQRRMEEARESITQTVAEIKDTVANQYQAVRETVTDALDWREQFRKRPVAFSVGALSVGFFTGYCLAGVFKGDRDSYSYDDEVEEMSLMRTASTSSPASSYYQSGGTEGVRAAATRSYAAQAATGSSSSYGSSDYDTDASRAAGTGAYSPAVYSSAAVAGEAGTGGATEEASGPGLIERFKGSKAYDRLEEEISALGDRFINELSKTAQTVVLPALFSKVKELFGVDLSDKEGGGASSQQRSSSSSSGGSTATNASLSGAAQSSFAGVNRGTSGREDESTLGGGSESGSTNESAMGGGSSYATSENRGYGATAGGGDYTRGSD
jgi:hypothetical protein